MGFFDDLSNLGNSLVSNSSNELPLQNTLSSLIGNFNQYIVTPLNAFGLGGFVFDVEGETITEITTDITDHFVENNSAIQDHIGVKPVEIVLRSYVGELVYRLDNNTDTLIQNVVQKLTAVSAYLPQLADAAVQVKSALDGNYSLASISNLSVSDITNAGTNIWGFIQNIVPPTTRQQQAYLYLKALAQQKILFSVQTPFEFINNMAIKSITAVQDETTKFVSDFTIRMKQMRFATTLEQPFNPGDYQPVSFDQNAPVTQNGKLPGSDPELSAPSSNLVSAGIASEPPDLGSVEIPVKPITTSTNFNY